MRDLIFTAIVAIGGTGVLLLLFSMIYKLIKGEEHNNDQF